MKLYNISMNNLRRRTGKMIFLVSGLFIGIATIVTLLAITESMSRDVEERLNQFGANIVMAPRSENLSLSYGGVTVGGVQYEVQELEERRLPEIRTIANSQNIGVIAPKALGSAVVKGKTVLLMGVDFEQEFALKTWWQWQGEQPRNPQDLLLGSEAAKVLGAAVGDNISIGGRDFHVSAVLTPTGASEDGIIVGDLKAVQALLNKEGKISLVEIAAFCRGCPINEMVLQIAEKFPEAKVSALKQVLMSKMQSIDMIRTFSYGIAALVIFVGSLMVFVTMMGSVAERTREIGIFRAIGFRQGHIMQIILLEAAIVGLGGGILGFVGGNAAAAAAIPAVIDQGAFAGINYSVGGLALLLGVSLSLLASLYPAYKASRLDPSEALRTL
ncbi:MAG: ABC transporter permease [Deltaproteobacteria bacterium]|nr:ABC transporter permease [Deltaproteobacteria bacterium]